MRFIKLAVISIIVFFIILTTLGLLLPSTVRVTRNINIHAPSDTLYQYISDVKQWPEWMEGINENTMKFSSSQTNGKDAAATINKTQIYLVKNTKNEAQTVWQNNSRTHQLCVFQLYADTAMNTTNLNWYFEQKLNWYPWERLPALANDKILGPFMEHSLDKLKAITETNKN